MSSPTSDDDLAEDSAQGSGGQVAAGDENLLDDLLNQTHDHETMFEDDNDRNRDDDEDEDEKYEEEARQDVKGDAPAEEEVVDHHSDISDSEHDLTDEEDGKNGRVKHCNNIVQDAEDISDKSEDEESGNGDAAAAGKDPEPKEELGDDDVRTERVPFTKREKVEPPSEDEKDGSPPPQATAAASAANQDKKPKKKTYDYATKLNYLFREARFFLVKSNNTENVVLSKARGVWSTPPANENRLNQAFSEARNVLLVFSTKESGKFCGLARLATASRRDVPPISWVLPPGLSASGVFRNLPKLRSSVLQRESFLCSPRRRLQD